MSEDKNAEDVQKGSNEVKLTTEDCDKLIEEHKKKVLMVDEFDSMAEQGHFHRLPDMKDLAGLPTKGFCIICIKGNLDLAKSLWEYFECNTDEIYYICAMFNLYTEVLLKGKMNVAEWLFSVISKCDKEKVTNILRHAIYYCSLKGNEEICTTLYKQVLTIHGFQPPYDIEKIQESKVPILDIVNNSVLYACSQKKYNNFKYLVDHNLISSKTLSIVNCSLPYTFNRDTLSFFDVNFVDTNKKIEYIDKSLLN